MRNRRTRGRTVRGTLLGTYTVLILLSVAALAAAFSLIHGTRVRSEVLNTLRQQTQAAAAAADQEINQMRTMAMNITYSTRLQDRLDLRQGSSGGVSEEADKLSMILSLIDSEPVFVKASAEFSELGVDYLTVAAIGFENRARASFNAGMILGKGTGSRFDRLYIHGTKGSIRSDVEYNQEGELSYRIYTPGSVKEETVLAPNNYALEIEQFGRCILEGETPYVSAEFSVKNAKLIDAVLKETGYY